MTQKLEILGTQTLIKAPISEWSSSAIVEFPVELTTFFQACISGSWKFYRKDGRYILALSNLPMTK